MANELRWKQEGYLHFAHASEGMYTIEQRRGQFIVTLDLKGAHPDGAEQAMGSHSSLAKAKSDAEKSHRVLKKQE